MIEIILFLGICFFGWGDCDEPVEEIEIDMISNFQMKPYNWEIVSTRTVQGIIGEVNKKEITFASGSMYKLENLEIELKAGQIITINKNYMSSKCEIVTLNFENGTYLMNERELEFISPEDLPFNYTFVNGEELNYIVFTAGYGWTDFLQFRLFDKPYPINEVCKNHERYEFVSIDSILTQEIPKGLQ